MPVVDVLELFGEGIPFTTILDDYYPDLSVDDILSCVRYAIKLVDTEEIRFSVES